MNNMIKTPEQLLNIMKVQAMGDVVYDHILGFIRPGMTEIMVADEIEKTFLKLGAKGLSFPTIVVSGSRGALIHGEPSEKIINEGEFVTIDLGGIYNGYCGDMTRTFALGSVTEEMEKIYDIVLTSQLAGLEAIKAGIKCAHVDKVCRDIIANEGYGEYFIHGTGHGVGTLVHVPPTLNAKSEEVLEEFMPVTVEPGIYIPDKCGVRIEDTVVVTDFGIINPTSSPKELIVL